VPHVDPSDPIPRLEAGAASDPSLLPALAEAHRRAGRPAQAERVARRGLERDPHALRLRVALALALLDQRRSDAAREVLEPVFGAEAGPQRPPDVSEQELEEAFAQAEPEADQLIDANRVAEQALLHTELGPADEIAPTGPSGAFATRTMAELLERQGDRAGAARIRARLAGRPEPARAQPTTATGAERRRRVVAELERWLANIRMEA
jgi:hypothetical protein